MTIFGWDLSHYDWDRGPVDLAAAVRDGISFMTHKVGEGNTVTDDRFDDFWKRARAAKVPLLGGYYVNHPGDQAAQADRFLSLLDAKAPGWRDGPFLLQVDAEKFSYMPREPSPSECEAFCDRLVQRTGGKFRPVLYAPKWLYGDRLTGVTYPLWASAYGTNPAKPYRTAYPGDSSTRWAAYSGQTPAILQYGSQTKIGTQGTCDANAFRGTLDQLRALVYPTQEDDVSAEEVWGHQVNWRGTGTDGQKQTVRADTGLYYAQNDAWAALQQAQQAVATVAALRADVAQALGRDPVDEDQIVQGVLAGLGGKDPQTIAAALLAVMSPEQARAVGALLAQS